MLIYVISILDLLKYANTVSLTDYKIIKTIVKIIAKINFSD